MFRGFRVLRVDTVMGHGYGLLLEFTRFRRGMPRRRVVADSCQALMGFRV